MTKKEIEIAVNQILNEVQRLEEDSQIRNATADFLGKQTDTLLTKSKTTISFEEREGLAKQMDALHGRIQFEMAELIKSASRLTDLNMELDYYSKLSEE
jgi:hypothetical protein